MHSIRNDYPASFRIVIGGWDSEAHDQNLRSLLEVSTKYGLTSNKDKNNFRENNKDFGVRGLRRSHKT